MLIGRHKAQFFKTSLNIFKQIWKFAYCEAHSLKSLYTRIISQKLFNKILAVYTIIIVSVLVALSYAILQNFTSSVKDEALNYNAQLIQSAENYYMEKNSIAKQIQQLPYLQKDTYIDVIRFLQSDDKVYTNDSISVKSGFVKYIRYISSLDSDIAFIYMLKTNDKSIYPVFSNTNLSESSIDTKLDGLLNPSRKEFYGSTVMDPNSLYALPANTKSGDFCTIAANFRDEELSGVIGTVFINFSTRKLSKISSKNTGKFAGELTILSKDGIVLFNTFNKGNGEVYPEFGNLKKLQSGTVNQKGNGISTLYYSQELGITIISTIQGMDINNSIKGTKRIIILITLLSIIIALILSYILMTFFSRKMKMVCSAMDLVKTGNFNERIPIGKKMDEISMISSNFNLMCDHLQDYIKEVYISGVKQKEAELKQRTAELYALQSQVNPHFLYNTLEAIRMKAVASGNEDVGKMVRLLAALFRHSIRYEMIIKIRDEIEYCKHYLELFRLRYGSRFEYGFDIENRVLDYAVVKHILQPLIENALVHGIDPDKEKNIISISATIEEEDIIFNIADNGVGIMPDNLKLIKQRLELSEPEDTGSIGLSNVNHRVKMIYGNNYGIMIDSTPGSGTVIELKILVKTVEELKKYV